MPFIPTARQLEDLLNSSSLYTVDSGYNEIIGGYAIPVHDGAGDVIAWKPPGSGVTAQVRAVIGDPPPVAVQNPLYVPPASNPVLSFGLTPSDAIPMGPFGRPSGVMDIPDDGRGSVPPVLPPGALTIPGAIPAQPQQESHLLYVVLGIAALYFLWKS